MGAGMGKFDALAKNSLHDVESLTRHHLAADRDSSMAPILVAVDMSAHSRAALVWAGQYAEAANAPLIVLHVLHDAPDAPGRYRSVADPLEPMRDTAERILAEFMAETRARYPELKHLIGATPQVIDGLPGARIVERAIQLKATLVVMGSCGKTGLRNFFNGSVALKVARISPIPVTLVKATH